MNIDINMIPNATIGFQDKGILIWKTIIMEMMHSGDGEVMPWQRPVLS